MVRLRVLRALARAVIAASAVVVVGLVSSAAYAAPSVEEIEAQIEQKWEQLEPVIEQYNKVHSQLAANQKKSAQLQKQIQPLALQTELVLARVGGIAAKQYKQGPASTLNAMLSGGSPTAFVEQLVFLNRLAQDEQRQIAAVIAARDKYNAEKVKLDALIAQQKQQDADLAAKKKLINNEMNKLQRLRLTAYGSSAEGGSLRIGPCPAVYIGGNAGIAVRKACGQIGKMYEWGSDGPTTFDCSGLTQYAWKAAGVSLTHHAAAQWREGTPVSRANARAGDLVFFFSDLHHVGMYVGNGLMVHASRAGQPVKMAPVDNMPLMGFRRVG